MSNSFNALADEIHSWSRGQGFYDREILDGGVRNLSFVSEKLLLVVSEVAEIQDALRDGDLALEVEELADAIIRLLDYGAWRGFDIDGAISAKMLKNRQRPPLHGRSVF